MSDKVSYEELERRYNECLEGQDPDTVVFPAVTLYESDDVELIRALAKRWELHRLAHRMFIGKTESGNLAVALRIDSKSGMGTLKRMAQEFAAGWRAAHEC